MLFLNLPFLSTSQADSIVILSVFFSSSNLVHKYWDPNRFESRARILWHGLPLRQSLFPEEYFPVRHTEKGEKIRVM